ncbi:hypothetical protein [Variovorax sp. Root411]|uniref:hypothetical protein n=1 Tax=Variovorax sp. Root411 TaxID=1736530 RepID=UPI0006F65A7A|nr:hypothetical protein [Variovorax sp. Root411]KQW59280.1 hypothetical protein ASC92_06530 [Variovorax sp. Root411]
MIDEKDAIALARAAAMAAGWAFVEPVQARLRKPWFGKGAARWEINSNAMAFGARARFVIDAVDGRILDKGYIPR